MMMYSLGRPGFGAGCSSVMRSCDSSGVGCVGRRVMVMLCLLLYSFVSRFVFVLSAMAMILTSVMKRVFRPETARAIPVRPLPECRTVDQLAAFVIGGTQDA